MGRMKTTEHRSSKIRTGVRPQNADPIFENGDDVVSGDHKRPTMHATAESFFSEPIDPRHEARELALETVRRLLIWVANGATLEERGLRTSVALFCIRPDLIDDATLEQIGDLSGRSRQAVHKLADNFRMSMGLVS